MSRRIAAALAAGWLMLPVLVPADETGWFSQDFSSKWISLSDPAPLPDDRGTSEGDDPGSVRLDPALAPCTCLEAAAGCDGLGCDGSAAGSPGDDCWLLSDQPLLHEARNRTLIGGLKYSVGGQLRYRYIDERNRLRPQGTLRRNSYQQWRFTPFLEVGNDWVTGYVRAIDAPTFDEDLPELPINVNRFDLMEYYVDAKLGELAGGEVRGRYGRMMLQYGDQHLISPLAWSNTFRTFEGGKVYYAGEDWDLDGFVVRPTNGAAVASAFLPGGFDQADQSILFSGVYATYKQARHGSVDLFWLWNDEDEPAFDGAFGFNRQDGSRHTIGARCAGQLPVSDGGTVLHTWNWNLQGGWQFGEDDFAALTDQDVNAGFVSAIGGMTLDRVVWTPAITGLFWWGSGDSDPDDGQINTFNTLYPLGHAYWGQIDNFNGANLIDYSVQVSVKPAKKLSLAAQMHWFNKASSDDYIYNIAGAPLGDTTTPDRHLGNELDLVATWQASQNLQLQLGYFWFWYGDAVNNQPALARDDARQLYFMTTWDF